MSGDAFYYASDGATPVIPLGTVLVTPKRRCPAATTLDDGRGNAPETHLAKVESDNDRIEAVSTYNSPVAKDTVKRGDYRLVKEVPVSIYSEGAGDMPQDAKRVLVPGVEFQLINGSTNPVTSPETGESRARRRRVHHNDRRERASHRKDEDAAASTDGEARGLERAALAYGFPTPCTVILRESPQGVQDGDRQGLLPASDFKITISTKDG